MAVYHGHVSPVSLAFFTIDHGTASTAVALIAPLEGRFRLLASGAAPRGAETEALLEDLVAAGRGHRAGSARRPGRVAPTGRGSKSATRPAHRVLCVAATESAAG